MSKKRLEEISERVIVDKVYYKYLDGTKGHWGKTYTLSEEDYSYLIEQAGRVQELEKENKRLEDFIETIQNVHFVELQREKAENRRYREVINNINEKAMLYGVDEQVFEAIKEAIRVLEGEE